MSSSTGSYEIIVGIKDCQVEAFIGVTDLERKNRQTLFIDLEVTLYRDEKVLWEDTLENTICYAHLEKICQKAIFDQPIKLLETFGQRILDHVFEDFRVKKATIKVKKPHVLKSSRYGYVHHVRIR